MFAVFCNYDDIDHSELLCVTASKDTAKQLVSDLIDELHMVEDIRRPQYSLQDLKKDGSAYWGAKLSEYYALIERCMKTHASLDPNRITSVSGYYYAEVEVR